MLALDLAERGRVWRWVHRSEPGRQRVGAVAPPVRAALPRAGLFRMDTAHLAATGRSRACEEWARWSGTGAAAPMFPQLAPRGAGRWDMEAARTRELRAAGRVGRGRRRKSGWRGGGRRW